MKNINYKSVFNSDSSVPFILLGMIFIFSFIQPAVVSSENLENIGRQAAILGILACGQLVAILVGGIDLSLGSIIGLTSVISTKVVLEFGIEWGLVSGVLVGVALGAINGYFIAYLRMPAMIVTLAMLYFARGAALIISGGMPVERLPSDFGVLGKGALVGIPNPVYIGIFIFFIFYLFLKYSRLGRDLFAVGGAEETSRLAGIPVERVKFIAFIISGATAGIAGIILSSRLNSGQPNLGDGLEFQAIAAVVLGGARLGGGKGTIFGTLLCTVFLGFLANGLNLLRFSSYSQMIVFGCVLILTMIIDHLRVSSNHQT